MSEETAHCQGLITEAAALRRNAAAAEYDAAREMNRPAVLFRPSLYVDGNQWCALYGENLQDGVAGFGDSPALALEAFDKAWITRLPGPTPGSPTKDP